MSNSRFRRSSLLGATAAVALSTALTAPALAQLDEIIVRAQKKEQSIQTVPVAVTAFDAGALESLQIEQFSDLQFNAPSLQFNQAFFGGTNVTIRGIGTLLTAASSESGVGIHINEMPVITSRIFEQEFTDIGSIEVLRGPQGTLFGRTATGGTVNIYTATPTDEYELWGNAQYGNYKQRKFEVGFNIPLSDYVQVRASGLHLKRDGFLENIASDQDFDTRDMYTLRGALRILPTENTTLDFAVGYFEEDSTRERVTKQLCTRDPSGLLGCLPGSAGFDAPNGAGTGGAILVTNETMAQVFGFLELPPALGGIGAPAGFAAGLGLGSFGDFGSNANQVIPQDLRQVSLGNSFSQYNTDELFVTGTLTQENIDIFGMNHTAAVIGGYQATSLFGPRGGSSPTGEAVNIPPSFAGVLATSPTTASYFPGGQFPVSNFSESRSGFATGDVFSLSNTNDAIDIPISDTFQWSLEGRVSSDYDGWFNWLAGVSWLSFESDSAYYVNATTLDYFSAVAGRFLGGGDGGFLGPPFFGSETPRNRLDSWGVFGEVYVEPIEDVKLTGGLRFTTDNKSVRDRGFFLNNIMTAGTNANDFITNGQLSLVPFASPPGVQAFDGDPTTPQPITEPFREAEQKFDELTGRAVVDWTPDLSFTEDTLLYASYSRGFKSGGFNPPIDTSLFAGFNIPGTFDPELIDAYEIGTKNTFLVNGVALTANISGFYYDYEGLQITNIINRTSVNQNINAEIKGAEGEFFAQLTDALGLNFGFSWLDTEITSDDPFIDARDPLQSGGIQRDGFQLVKDIANGENCVVGLNGNAPISQASVAATATALSAITGTTINPFPFISPLGQNAALPLGAFSSCAGLDGFFSSQGYTVTSTGLSTSLEGNELPSPDFSMNIGGQYTHTFDNQWRLTGRADFYYQNSYFANLTNTTQDEIESWTQLNLLATLEPEDQGWYIQGFAQNVTAEDNITFKSVGSQPTALTTNINVLDPRTWGFQAGVRF